MRILDIIALRKEIDHIFESGANEIRILEMTTAFIDKRFGSWVDVNIRLPEKEGHFLVHTPRSFPKNCPCAVAEYYVDGKFRKFYDEAYECPLDDVTHWMPITPPETP